MFGDCLGYERDRIRPVCGTRSDDEPPSGPLALPVWRSGDPLHVRSAERTLQLAGLAERCGEVDTLTCLRERWMHLCRYDHRPDQDLIPGDKSAQRAALVNERLSRLARLAIWRERLMRRLQNTRVDHYVRAEHLDPRAARRIKVVVEQAFGPLRGEPTNKRSDYGSIRVALSEPPQRHRPGTCNVTLRRVRVVKDEPVGLYMRVRVEDRRVGRDDHGLTCQPSHAFCGRPVTV